MKRGCKFGSHRVIKPQGVLPQAASLIDNDMTIYDNEILVDVQALNIDSASFAQLKQAHGCDAQAIGQAIMDIVNQRGKMQNPVTGSGGMLIGTVAAIGSKLADKIDLAVGDEIATLVSLSLTPLHIESIQRIHLDIDRVEIVGQAVLFESGIYAKLPSDMSRELALAALDVAGAPAQTAKLVRPGDRVLVIGASGKSGMLCCYEAMKRVGPTGQVIGLVRTEESRQQLQSLGLCHDYILGDATNSMLVYQMPAAPQLQRIHMILNKRAHQLGLLIAQPQASRDFADHLGTDLLVPVEGDPSLADGTRRRFADIVQPGAQHGGNLKRLRQRRPIIQGRRPDSWRDILSLLYDLRKGCEGAQAVVVHRKRMVLVLRHPLHGTGLGQQHLGDAEAVQIGHAQRSLVIQQNLPQLLRDALGRCVGHIPGACLSCFAIASSKLRSRLISRRTPRSTRTGSLSSASGEAGRRRPCLRSASPPSGSVSCSSPLSQAATGQASALQVKSRCLRSSSSLPCSWDRSSRSPCAVVMRSISRFSSSQ